MPVHGHFQGFFISWSSVRIGINHIRQQECSTFLLDGISQITERLRNVCSVGCRFKLYDFADNMKKVTASLFRRNEFLDLVAEKQRTHLVIVDDGRE